MLQRGALLSLIALGSLAATAGCAAANRENRPLTSALDRRIRPESTASRVALAPVAIPLGLASLALDIAVAHPVLSIPTSYDETADAIWRDPQGSYLRQTFLFVPKAALTPAYFGGDLLVRSSFDIR